MRRVISNVSQRMGSLARDQINDRAAAAPDHRHLVVGEAVMLWHVTEEVRERRVSVFCPRFWAVPIRKAKLERGQGHQLSRFDKIEVDPGENMQLLSTLKFGADDLRDRVAQAQIQQESAPLGEIRKGNEPSRVPWYRPWDNARARTTRCRECDRIKKIV